MSAQTARTLDADGVYRTEPIERTPGAEPDGVMFRWTHLPGAVDLAHAATLPEWAFQSARICDVAKTVDAGDAAFAEATVEFVGKKMGELRKIVDAQIGSVDRGEGSDSSSMLDAHDAARVGPSDAPR